MLDHVLRLNSDLFLLSNFLKSMAMSRFLLDVPAFTRVLSTIRKLLAIDSPNDDHYSWQKHRHVKSGYLDYNDPERELNYACASSHF